MARMEPVAVSCLRCGKELHLPVRVIPTDTLDRTTATFTATVSTEPAERHLADCTGEITDMQRLA